MFAFANIAIRGTTEAATARAAKCKVKLPEAFDPWFWKMTAKRAEDRFQSASAAIEALAAALEVELPAAESSAFEAPELAGDTTLAGVLPPRLDSRHTRTLNRRTLSAVAVAALAGAVVAGIVTVRKEKQQQALESAHTQDATAPVETAAAPEPASASARAQSSAESPVPAPDASATAAAVGNVHAQARKPVASATAPVETAPAPTGSRRSMYTRE